MCAVKSLIISIVHGKTKDSEQDGAICFLFLIFLFHYEEQYVAHMGAVRNE